MFYEPISFVRKDKTEFFIDVVPVVIDEQPKFALRVWHNDVVVNNVKSEYFTNAEDAFDVGLKIAKEYKCT